MVIFLLLVWLLFIFLFYHAIASEIAKTHWDLLETLIVVNILGHPVAIAITCVFSDYEKHPSFYAENGGVAPSVVMAGLGGTIVSMLMFGGVVWVFRRLKVLNVVERWWRMAYMVLGLLLFPTIITAPVSFMVSWLVWVPLFLLNMRYEVALQRSGIAQRRAL